jgi:hypothetical protein
MIFGFANTGEEHEETLIFTDRCDREYNLGLIWLEAVTHPNERKGCTHKIVTFETAARKGEPFEEMIGKYGIPNKAYPHCTRELKLNVMRSYLESVGWLAGSYKAAVGIRVDEPKRLHEASSHPMHRHTVYPLAHWFPMTKPQILAWWAKQPFDLNLPEELGNCKWCWKKSLRKHGLLARHSPQVFEFPARMEQEYGLAGHNEDGNKRVFFRGNLSTQNLLAVVTESDLTSLPDSVGSTCTESCEAFG